MNQVAYIAGKIAVCAVAAMLVWKGHWIAGVIVVLLIAPTLRWEDK